MQSCNKEFNKEFCDKNGPLMLFLRSHKTVDLLYLAEIPCNNYEKLKVLEVLNCVGHLKFVKMTGSTFH